MMLLPFYLSTYFLEGFDALVEVLTLVCSTDLYADTSLSLRNYGIVETCYEDTFFLHLGSVLLLSPIKVSRLLHKSY